MQCNDRRSTLISSSDAAFSDVANAWKAGEKKMLRPSQDTREVGGENTKTPEAKRLRLAESHEGEGERRSSQSLNFMDHRHLDL